jgi:ABC-2 type transport system ATP-binding protein
LLQINAISKRYNSNQMVINKLSFSIEAGVVFGLLGPNGSGKSTTINCITGIYPVDEGDIIIDGYNIAQNPLDAKRKVGYVPDNSNMFLHLRGIEYLEFLQKIYRINDNHFRNTIQELAHKFEMVKALNDFIQNYSFGMRKKLFIIGSLLQSPKVWILDEPFNGLDPKAVFGLKTLMRSYCDKGNVVLFSTHLLDIAQQVCDRVGILNKGNLILNGDFEEIQNNLKTKDSLEKLFLELTNDEYNAFT